MDAPITPPAAYKAIIDQLVGETRLFGSGSMVKERGIFSNAPAHSEFNEFIHSLSPKHRDLLASMLIEERDGAIHDVLALLTWWTASKGVELTLKGEPLPADLSGTGMHGDYVGRRDGWEWPEAGA